MTTSYLTETTITDTQVIVRSSIGNTQKFSVINRGNNEDTELRDAAVAHKQFADLTLGTDTPARTTARRSAAAAAAVED